MSSKTHPGRRSLLAIAAAVTALTLVAGPSMAVFPHFKSAKTTPVYPRYHGRHDRPRRGGRRRAECAT
ncbi:hypothetical protein [Nocardioides sp. B-3]|uniref:hypothetical protein n=1 Tax=Nocardioides sp. B-3 TaxID=2895565 RepID=UPI0021529B95|nr:hypothetical protein [Nocardioides sp. B-3]UUZ60506.1 hypothetical protein LP418_06435 [Nocardioides sp. B-3]